MPWNHETPKEPNWWDRRRPKVTLRDVWVQIRLMRTEITGHTAAIQSLRTDLALCVPHMVRGGANDERTP